MADKLLSSLFGLIGVITGFIGSYLLLRTRIGYEQKKEISTFYSWVASIANSALEGGYREAMVSLTAPELHYVYAKLWFWIPEKMAVDKETIDLRKEIFSFLKEGHEVQRKVESGQIKKLFGALRKMLKP